MTASTANAGFALPLAAAGAMLLAVIGLPLTGWISEGVDRVASGRAEVARERAFDEALDRALRDWLAADQPAETDAVAPAARVTDEGLRLDLLTATREQLERLLDRLAVPAELRDQLVDPLFDWIDADDVARPGGAEADAYRALGRPGPPPWLPRTPLDPRAVIGWEAVAADPRWREAVAVGGGGAPISVARGRAVVRIDLDIPGHGRGLTLVARRGDAATDGGRPWRIDWSARLPVSSTRDVAD